jgi:SSS family solute:Na+ symporter
MSTLDSLINTGALSLTIDIYSKYINNSANTKQLVKTGRFATLIIGTIALIIALKIQSLLKLSWMASDLITTTIFTPLVLGFVWKRASVKGTLASILFGFCFSCYNLLIFLGIKLPAAWQHQSTEQAIIGIIGSTLLFTIFSLMSKKETKAINFVNKVGIIKTIG